jgi:predicted dehydrogenase
VSATNVARKFGFAYCTCDYHELLNDPEINCIVIATRHNLHAPLTLEALRAGKHVFVEKPLCLNEIELREIFSAYSSRLTPHASPPFLMVGFNRRFSPFIQELKKFLAKRMGPLIMSYRVNAGYVPPDHWVHDPSEGGGRILGEVCHFVDLLQYLAGAKSIRVFAQSTRTLSGRIPDEDNVQVTIMFGDGSTGTITYTAAGNLSFPRERLEVFADGTVAAVDNYRKAIFIGQSKRKKIRSWSQDMGHRHEIAAFVSAMREGGPPPIPFEEIVLSTLTTLQIKKSLQLGTPVEIDLSQVLRLQEATDQMNGSSTVQEKGTGETNVR